MCPSCRTLEGDQKPQEASTAVDADSVTLIQDGLQSLCGLFWEATHELLARAPAVSVRGEPVENRLAAPDSEALAKGFAARIAAVSRRIDAQVASLPDITSSEEEQLAEVAALVAGREAARRELAAELALGRAKMGEVRALHAALADAELKCRAAALDRREQ